jgi:G:T/U-mismatch repair DNA glycosylase
MEINMTENEFWNIDELVALTDEVQTSEVDYNEKKLKFQYCELTEGEEPKLDLPPADASEEEQNKAYQRIGQARILAMIDKANKKNPEGATVSAENWEKLPSTIRWGLSQAVLGGGTNFRQVDE